MKKIPMMTIYRNGIRTEVYTDGTAVVENCTLNRPQIKKYVFITRLNTTKVHSPTVN